MAEETLQVVTTKCKDCQFYRDYGNYQVCNFWSVDRDDEFIEAFTEPDGYCHNALPSDRSRR